MSRFAVIGLGRFGLTLAKDLQRQGADVVAIDIDEQLVESVKDKVAVALKLDATDEAALEEAGLQGLDAAVVAIGDKFEAVQLAMIALKTVGVKHVVARSNGEVQDKILWRLGADEVVNPENEAAIGLAARLMRPGLLEQLGDQRSEVFMVQTTVPKKWVGRTFSDVTLDPDHEVTIVAFVEEPAAPEPSGNEAVEDAAAPPPPRYVVPAPDAPLREGAEIVIFGPRAVVEKLTK